MKLNELFERTGSTSALKEKNMLEKIAEELEVDQSVVSHQ